MYLRLYRVIGHSMYPDLADGDFVLALGRTRQVLHAGDRVVIDHPEFGRIIKRIVRILPGGDLDVAGDNRLMSTHSEQLGCISRGQILGKVLVAIRGPGARSNPTGNRASAVERAMTHRPQTLMPQAQSAGDAVRDGARESPIVKSSPP